MLDNLGFSRFKAYFRVDDPLRLPHYTGTILHDALGQAFWNTRFGAGNACPACPIRSECRYQNLRAYFFKSPADHPFIKPAHEALVRMMQRDEYPQPFVFDPMAGGEYQPGDQIVFPFTLVGRAIAFFPFMACALSRLGGPELGLGGKRIALEAIVNGAPSPSGEDELVYDARAGDFAGPCEVIDFDDVRRWVSENNQPSGRPRLARLNFLTPFRYKAGDKLGQDLTFEIFMKNLLRRLTLLSVHSPLAGDLDYRRLLALAAEVETASSNLRWGRRKRHSFSQGDWMRLDGLLGDITFSGNLDDFLPHLRMGEFLNVGKAASFGHGKYELDLPSDQPPAPPGEA
ncbi:MAG: CRISPR system precrRNA processing endoribonuclease RAMP protein Cas6 [Pseudomonadota bacterium]